jgi:phosphatidylethanolamine-binding protein (PEBP) family uncharacterized protein
VASKVPKLSIWRSLILIALVFTFAFAMSHEANATPIRELPNVTITVNGTRLPLDAQNPAIEVNWRILVPMRVIFEALGAAIDWNEATQTVTGIGRDYSVILRIGSNRATLNGVDRILDVMPMLYQMRTYVPVRFVGEATGAEVFYDEVTGNVTITSGGGTQPPVQPPPTLGNLRNISVTTGFTNGQAIPIRFQGGDHSGANEVSPGVQWSSVSGAVSYLVTMVDVSRDSDGFLSWLVHTPANVTRLVENASSDDSFPEDVDELIRYLAPELYEEDGRHDFEIRVYALSAEAPNAVYTVGDINELLVAIAPYAIAQGAVSGFINFGRQLVTPPARPADIRVTSAALGMQRMPIRYTDSFTDTAEGDGISIPVSWSGRPNGTLSYAVIFIDISPGMDNYVHWLVANIPATATQIVENASDLDRFPEGAEEIIFYEPPLLDEEDGRRNYRVIVVALNDILDGMLELEMAYSYDDFLEAISGHLLGWGQLDGWFQVS